MPITDLPIRPPPECCGRSRGRVHFITYGCQMNVLDSELVAGELVRAGYEITAEPSDATVVLYNTCSVRQLAEDKVRSSLGKLHARKRRDPDLVVGVLGCMAQREGQDLLERFPAVDMVCGTRGYHRLSELLERARAGERVVLTDETAGPCFDREVSHRPDRRQALVAVMRGCSMRCAYCIVPAVRGPEVSRPLVEVVEEVRRLAADGVTQVTLLGQNVDAYGRSLRPRVRLADLLAAVHELPGLQRIRFLTSHPRDIDEELLVALRDLPRVARFLHMPAQSGSDRILRAMRRGYTRDRYLGVVARARHLLEHVEIASDFIVGFPGETEDDFALTETLVREVGFQTSFVFKYSARPGTPAADLADDVPLATKQERNQRLLRAQQETAVERHRALHGRCLQVLVDGPSRTNPAMHSGRTAGNHIVVFAPPVGVDLRGALVHVRITDSTALSLRGELVMR